MADLLYVFAKGMYAGMIFLCPFVFVIVGLGLKNNVHMKMGSSGYVTRKAKETEEVWIYAQITAPALFLKMAAVCAGVDLLLAAVLAVLKINLSIIMTVCNCAGIFFLVGFFFLEDRKLEEFQKCGFFEERNMQIRKNWVKLAHVLVSERRTRELKDCVSNEKLRNELFTAYHIT